ncbi:PIN domain-containing protein [Seonamhaeicola marinus]|uniref:DUF4935 domain-containing protein n=1 Tax=Seonamhaeicola marinus TaxID=1912246 RepID=A0A5D0J1U7_9FLAO|nr:PIN domain-containing protein [Seonamhaeicola marinus]TYA89198.1 hypothetical protein FUA24_03415 [Seonamhaeicola marinus]
MLKTRNIFIDTETFVANNFFQNKNLSRLAEFGKMDTVNLYLTEITIKEIQSNIREELQYAQDEINRFKKNIANKGRILKNVEEYSKYISLPKLDINVDYDKINEELDKFIETGKITIIPFTTADLRDIIYRYFNREKPFGLGKKKYEFPDAIVLSAIEKWCEEYSCQIYVVSQDKDLKDYTSKNIIPIPNLRTILNKINTQFNNDRLEWINKIFLDSEEIIKEKIIEKFSFKIKDEIWYDVSIENVEVDEIKLFEPSIVQDNQDIGETIFQFDFDISFSMDVYYSDHSLSSYDKEDDKWYFPEPRTVNIALATTQTAEISIEAIYEDRLLNKNNDISIFCSYCSIPDSEKITDELDGYQLQL